VGLLLGKKDATVPLLVKAEKEKSENDAELDEWFGSDDNKEDEE